MDQIFDSEPKEVLIRSAVSSSVPPISENFKEASYGKKKGE
jgi:hypothetical protein